jgi:hypothetical protein
MASLKCAVIAVLFAGVTCHVELEGILDSAPQLGKILGVMNHTAHAESHGFGGSTMERTFTKYDGLPVGESALSAAGWTKGSTCDPAIGFMWTQSSNGPTKSKPLVLYTTKAGQMSGVGVSIYGELPKPQQVWITDLTANGANGYRIDVAFRKGSILCSGEKSNALIGDALVVNPRAGSGAKELSLTQAGAEAAGWHRGSCFDGMGTHSFLDTATTDNSMSWKAENLFPVVAMYHNGEVNAIFFASWVVQQNLPFSANQWEPVPLPDSAMCVNTCDDDCTFDGTWFWSTFHIYFNDHNKVKCDSSLSCKMPTMGCCPKKNILV